MLTPEGIETEFAELKRAHLELAETVTAGAKVLAKLAETSAQHGKAFADLAESHEKLSELVARLAAKAS